MKSAKLIHVILQYLAVLTACFAVPVGLWLYVGQAFVGYSGPFWGPGGPGFSERPGDPMWYNAWPYIMDWCHKAFIVSNFVWLILYPRYRRSAIYFGRAIVTVMLLFLLTHIVMTLLAIQYRALNHGGVLWYRDLWASIIFQGWYIVTMGVYCFSRRASGRKEGVRSRYWGI
jgi:hypothetical protein